MSSPLTLENFLILACVRTKTDIRRIPELVTPCPEWRWSSGRTIDGAGAIGLELAIRSAGMPTQTSPNHSFSARLCNSQDIKREFRDR